MPIASTRNLFLSDYEWGGIIDRFEERQSIEPMESTIQNVLLELRDGLVELYGNRMRTLILYGSHARREATEGSDIDVALFLDDFASATDEISFFSPFVASLCLKQNCVISVIPLRERDRQTRQTPLLMNIRREGVPVPVA